MWLVQSVTFCDHRKQCHDQNMNKDVPLSMMYDSLLLNWETKLCCYGLLAIRPTLYGIIDITTSTTR